MKALSAPVRLIAIYRHGLTRSPLARRLLMIILLKIILLLVVFRLFLMPDQLSSACPDDDSKAQAVRTSLMQRAT